MIIKLSYGFIFNYFYTIFTYLNYFTQLSLLNLNIKINKKSSCHSFIIIYSENYLIKIVKKIN